MLKLQVVLVPPSALRQRKPRNTGSRPGQWGATVLNSSPYTRDSLGTSTPNNNNNNNNNSSVLIEQLAPQQQLRKFLHITGRDKELLEVAGEIAVRFSKLYPDDEPLDILKLQDSNECDLDPEYIAGDIFDTDNVVNVLLLNEIKSLDAAIDKETEARALKRRASGNMSSLTIPKKRAVNNRNRDSLWGVEGGESRRSTPLSNQVYPESSSTSNRSFNMSVNDDSEVSLPPPEDSEIPIKDPKKQKPAPASPLPSSRRITSGMLVAPEPQLKDAADATLHEQEINEQLSMKKIPSKKQQQEEDHRARKSSPRVEEILANASRETSFRKMEFSESEDEENFEEALDEPEFTKDEIINIFKTGRFPLSVRKKLAQHSLTKPVPIKGDRAAAVVALKKIVSVQFPEIEVPEKLGKQKNAEPSITTTNDNSTAAKPDTTAAQKEQAKKQQTKKDIAVSTPSKPARIPVANGDAKNTQKATSKSAASKIEKTPKATPKANKKAVEKAVEEAAREVQEASKAADKPVTKTDKPNQKEKPAPKGSEKVNKKTEPKSNKVNVKANEKKSEAVITTPHSTTSDKPAPTEKNSAKKAAVTKDAVSKDAIKTAPAASEKPVEKDTDVVMKDVDDDEHNDTVIVKKAKNLKPAEESIKKPSSETAPDVTATPKPSKKAISLSQPVGSSTPASSHGEQLSSTQPVSTSKTPQAATKQNAKFLMKQNPYDVSLFPLIGIEVEGLADLDAQLSDPKVDNSVKDTLLETRKKLIRNAKNREKYRLKKAEKVKEASFNTTGDVTKDEARVNEVKDTEKTTAPSKIILPQSQTQTIYDGDETRKLFEQAKAGILAKKERDTAGAAGAEKAKVTTSTKKAQPLKPEPKKKPTSDSGSDSDSDSSASDSDSDSDEETSKAPPRIVNSPKSFSQPVSKMDDLRKKIAKSIISEESISLSQPTTPSSKDSAAAAKKKAMNSRKSLSSLTDLASRGVPDVQDSLTPKSERVPKTATARKPMEQKDSDSSDASTSDSSSSSSSDSSSDSNSDDDDSESKKFLNAKVASDLVSGGKKKGKRMSSAFRGLINDAFSSQK